MRNLMTISGRILKKRESYIIGLTFLLWTIIALLNRNFISIRYLTELVGVSGIYFICSLGVLPLMIKGDFDLSVGGLMAMVSLLLINLLEWGQLPLLLVVIISILLGTGLGALNGFLISKLQVSSVVVTLAMMNIFYGLSRFLLRRLNPGQSLVDNGLFRFLPNGILLMNLAILLMIGLTFYFLRYNRLGRSIFAFGGNRDLAIKKGFKEERVSIFVHMFSGFSGGMAAVLHVLTFRQMSIEAYSGIAFELIIIVIIGGLNILGGYGSVLGTFFASLFIVILKSGLVFAKISVFWHDMIIGFIIIMVISLEMYRHKKQQRMLLEQGG